MDRAFQEAHDKLNRQVKLNMKKLLMLLCAASIIVTAIGCGSKTEEGGATPETTTTKGANDPAGDTKKVEDQ